MRGWPFSYWLRCDLIGPGVGGARRQRSAPPATGPANWVQRLTKSAQKGGEVSMAVYDWTHLLQRWENGTIETEQMIGQLLQWGQQTHEQAARCEHKQVVLE